MTKSSVLSIFAKSAGFLTPDTARSRLNPLPDRRSFYSYLSRLERQGLLERHPASQRGSLAYRLSCRGKARLEYFHRIGRA